MSPRRPPRSALPILALPLLLAGAGCESMDLAPGDLNDIFAAADPDLWSQVEDTVDAALQPTVLTVTDELAFQVVHQDPGAPEWSRIQKFKQLLLVGPPDDPWIAPALEEADEEDVEPPTVFQVRDVWSRNQIVTVALLSSEEPAQVGSLLPELSELYERQYRQYALAKMFVSGRDSALADTLRREAGFSILVPEVYQWIREDSTWLFRNDNPSPDELIRQVVVTWRTPVPTPLDTVLALEPVLEWRQAVAEETVETGQVVDTSMVRAREISYRDHEAFEVQAIWQNPPDADWPAGGPFITRAVACPEQDRLYLLDAWLYAPGRDKYEYMIQLNTILDSFRCGG